MNTTRRTHHGRIIDTSTRLKTTPQRAFDAWADPQHIANWFVDRAEGRALPGEVMTWVFDAFNYRQPVPIMEAVPGETLVIGSGEQPGPHGHPYALEITIAKDGGDTVLRLVNSGFSEDATFDDEYDGVVSGWKMALATMKQWLERYPHSRRVHRIVMEPATYAPSALQPLFSTVEGRRQWLEPPVPADSAVLTDTGSEVLLSWDEHDAVIGLKAFKMGPQRMLALDLSSWSEGSLPLDTIEPAMRAAIGRLKAVL